MIHCRAAVSNKLRRDPNISHTVECSPLGVAGGEWGSENQQGGHMQIPEDSCACLGAKEVWKLAANCRCLFSVAEYIFKRNWKKKHCAWDWIMQGGVARCIHTECKRGREKERKKRHREKVFPPRNPDLLPLGHKSKGITETGGELGCGIQHLPLFNS